MYNINIDKTQPVLKKFKALKSGKLQLVMPDISISTEGHCLNRDFEKGDPSSSLSLENQLQRLRIADVGSQLHLDRRQ
jgi:hypothetical protein